MASLCNLSSSDEFVQRAQGQRNAYQSGPVRCQVLLRFEIDPLGGLLRPTLALYEHVDPHEQRVIQYPVLVPCIVRYAPRSPRVPQARSPSHSDLVTTSHCDRRCTRLHRQPNHASPVILTQGQGRAAWRRRSVGRVALLLGRGSQARGVRAQLGGRIAHSCMPRTPARAQPAPRPAPPRTRESVLSNHEACEPSRFGGGIDAASLSLQSRIGPAGGGERRRLPGEGTSRSACAFAVTKRDNQSYRSAAPPPREAAPCAEHAGASSACDVQHSGESCAAASKTALWVPLLGRVARPAAAAVDCTWWSVQL